MTSEIIQKLIEVAPADFHTVATICGEPDGGEMLVYISPADVQAGNARVIGAANNVNLSGGNLPALLLYETGVATGVLFLVWHRNYDLTEENAGVRMSVEERDKVMSLFNKIIYEMTKSGLNFRQTTQAVPSYENRFGAFCITTTYKWEPQNCGNTNIAEVPHYTPGLY